MWAAFSSTSPDMKDTKASLSKKKKDSEENEEEEGNGRRRKIWRDVDRGKLREGPKEGKNSAKGDSSSSKVRGAMTSSPIRFTQGEEEEVLLERPEREF